MEVNIFFFCKLQSKFLGVNNQVFPSPQSSIYPHNITIIKNIKFSAPNYTGLLAVCRVRGPTPVL